MNPLDGDDVLVREAEIAKNHLLDTIDELDARKHRVESMRLVLPTVAGAAVGVLFVVAGVVVHARTWSRRRHRRRALHRFAKTLKVCG